MRRTQRRDAERWKPLVGEDARFCALCEAVMLFEQVDRDGPDADRSTEWVCVTCGSAVFVDPPVQAIGRTA